MPGAWIRGDEWRSGRRGEWCSVLSKQISVAVTVYHGHGYLRFSGGTYSSRRVLTDGEGMAAGDQSRMLGDHITNCKHKAQKEKGENQT